MDIEFIKLAVVMAMVAAVVSLTVRWLPNSLLFNLAMLAETTEKRILFYAVLIIGVGLFLQGTFGVGIFVLFIGSIPISARYWLFQNIKKDSHLALEYYPKYIELHPNDGRYLYWRSKHYRKLGQFQEALDDYNVIRELITEGRLKEAHLPGNLDPLSLESLHYFSSIAYLGMRDFNSAIAECDAGLDMPELTNTHKALLLNNRAEAFMELDNIEKATSDLDNIEAILDTAFSGSANSKAALNAMFQLNRSLINYRLGQVNLALEHWQKARSFDKQFADTDWLKTEFAFEPTWRLEAMLDMNERIKALT